MSYIEQAELENYLKRELTAEEESTFTIAESAVKGVVDNYCSTNFDDVTETSYKYFDGGDREIDIDPCKEIDEIAYVDEDLETDDIWETDDYVAEPKNETIKDSIRYRTGRTLRGISNIRISAMFTSYDAEVPSGVKLACLKMLAGVFNNAVEAKSESIEGYSITFADMIEKDAEIEKWLVPYRQVLL